MLSGLGRGDDSKLVLIDGKVVCGRTTFIYYATEVNREFGMSEADAVTEAELMWAEEPEFIP